MLKGEKCRNERKTTLIVALFWLLPKTTNDIVRAEG